MEAFIKTALCEGFKVKDSNFLEATNFRLRLYFAYGHCYNVLSPTDNTKVMPGD